MLMPTVTVTCPYCGGDAPPVSSREVYAGRDFGTIYLCRPCGAYVGSHKGTGEPLGTPANAELRDLRRKAHAALDPLWRSGRMTRTDAYRWLALRMGLTPDACHIGLFGPEQCRLVVRICEGDGRA